MAWNPAPLYTWEFLFCFNHSESLLCQSFPDRLLHCPVVIASNSIHHMGLACKTIQKLNSGYFRCVHSCKVWRPPSRSMASRRGTAEIYGQWNPPSWTYLVCGRKEIGLCNGNFGRSAILYDVWNSVRVARRDVTSSCSRPIESRPAQNDARWQKWWKGVLPCLPQPLAEWFVKSIIMIDWMNKWMNELVLEWHISFFNDQKGRLSNVQVK